MRSFARVKPETPRQRRLLARAQEENDSETSIERPRQGGTLWMGESEAASVTRDIVHAADRTGQLRGLIDAVRSNRVVDDFLPVGRSLGRTLRGGCTPSAPRSASLSLN